MVDLKKPAIWLYDDELDEGDVVDGEYDDEEEKYLFDM